ncbi:hypothetical protein ACFYTQ_26320 [Nocardia sp. NPDC004068]|uniref:hypothetical protein n=1 Tax=Nocardia sp. NPDC004068 TaxID=3364303 RepID=UPI00367B8152
MLAVLVTMFTALVVGGARTAQAAPAKGDYLVSRCLVKALTPKGGPRGDGCSVWGIPQYAGPRSPQDMPDKVNDAIGGCVTHGAMELVLESEFVLEEAEIPVIAVGTGLFIAAVGCVSGASEAMNETAVDSKTPSTDASLGGLDLNDYCSRTYNGATAHVRDTNSAFSWECVHGNTHAGYIDIDAQCQHQYGPQAVSGLHDSGNPYAWYCRKKG